jgi:tRNA (cmo5U34)-methyltransferase
MSDWSEDDSATFRAIAAIAVPRRHEMMATMLALVPFAAGEAFRIVEIGTGEGRLSEALLDRFSAATLLALDGSDSMRAATSARTARFGDRRQVRPFDLAALDWWDLMYGADVVMASLCLHHLNDAKKQYLYKAIADRLSPRGACVIADLVEPGHPAARRLAADAWDRDAQEQAEAAGRPDQFARFIAARWNHFRFPDAADQPSAMLHHLVWLKHAGFESVDCFWMYAGHAVFGGFKQDGERQAGA